MKKIFKLLIVPLLFGFGFVACGPPEPLPQFVKKIEVRPGVEIGPYEILYCPNVGTNCAVLPCTQNRQAYLDTFYQLYNHDSAQYYFSYRDWSTLFPQLGESEQGVDILYKLQNGTFTVAVDYEGGILVLDPTVTITDSTSYMAAAQYAFKVDPCH